MKRARQRGQILPIAAVILFALILFAGVNAQRWHVGIRKMEQQREADSLLIVAATEQARALNAIAALNKGLSTTVERVTEVGIAYMALEACAASVWGTAWCTAPFLRLSQKMPGFIKKARKLGETIAKYQDNIVKWAAEAPNNMFVVQEPRNQLMPTIFLFPTDPDAAELMKSSRLAVIRAGTDDLKGLTNDQRSIAKKEDIFKMDPPKIYSSFASLKSAIDGGQLQIDGDDIFTVHYVASETSDTKVWSPQGAELHNLAADMNLVINGQTRYCHFSSAKYIRRTGLKGLLDKLEAGLSGSLGVPGPMVLHPTFFQGRNRLRLARVSKINDGRMDFLLREVADQSVSHKNIWAVSEVEITGSDLQEMEFSVRLADPTRQEELWDVVDPIPFTGNSAPFEPEKYNEKQNTEQQTLF